MPFCPSCGKEVRGEGAFCESCGQQIKQRTPADAPDFSEKVYPPKNPITAVAASLFVVGLGQMYVGQVIRGIALLFAIFMTTFIALFNPSVWVVVFVLWSVNLYDAYRIVDRYNQYLWKHGEPPW